MSQPWIKEFANSFLVSHFGQGSDNFGFSYK